MRLGGLPNGSGIHCPAAFTADRAVYIRFE